MLPKRIIYHEFADKHRIQIVKYLYENYDWDPVFIAGYSIDAIKDWLDDNHPSCVFQETMKLRQAQFDYSKIGEPIPIDIEIINSLSEYELNFMGMLGTVQDPTGWNYSFEERKKYYFDILKYWNTVIHYFKPDIFISFTQPHTPTCNSLYLLCKYYYNIDVLFLDPVSLLNQYYHMIGISLEELHAPIINAYKSGEKLEPSSDTRKYLNELRSDNAKIPGYILDCHKDFDSNSPIFRFKPFLKLLLSTLIKGTGFLKSIDWKKNKKPYYLLESRMNNLEYFLFIEILRQKSKNLKKYYLHLCVEPDFSRKYLYFAASYQPEANTATNAGAYESFLLVLDMLSNVIPKDWVIYYKENPTTFRSSPSNKGALKRDINYFKRINVYKNIQLVSSDINTFKLIDGAQAVATVSGTVAWEAAVRGKPALSFGSAWYMGCKSIFWIKTLQDARDAMEMIVGSYAPDQADIERYAAAIEKIAVKGLIHRDFNKRIEKIPEPQYELERISKALYEAYERHYI